MKEHAYRFNRDMTRAVLDGRKWMTRRPIKQVPYWDHCGKNIMDWPLSDCYTDADGKHWLDIQSDVDDNCHEEIYCPYGKPGDTFRLSEAVQVLAVDHERYSLLFEADLMHCERYGDPELIERIKGYKRGHLRGCTLPPAFCRSQRWEITEVRAERVQDITEEDAIAEGVGFLNQAMIRSEEFGRTMPGAVYQFAKAWQSIYGQESWICNDWVWVIAWKAVSDAS